MICNTYYNLIRDAIFYLYNFDNINDTNPIEKHAMTIEHEEILGQFLDFTGMDVEQLKKVLILGYLENMKG